MLNPKMLRNNNGDPTVDPFPVVFVIKYFYESGAVIR